MPAPSNLNSRIAIAKGWKRGKKRLSFVKGYNGPLSTAPRFNTNWRNPEGKPAIRPDFVDTLEGLAGMMRELGHAWVWYFDERILKWCCYRRYHDSRVGTGGQFQSDPEHPGDCVGEAYMGILGKEAADDRK